VSGDGLVFQDLDILKADPDDFRPLCLQGRGGGNQKCPMVGDHGGLTLPDGTTKELPLRSSHGHYRGHCNVYAGGFYYYRGWDRLYCVDFRKGEGA
jgi:hypothetical protein